MLTAYNKKNNGELHFSNYFICKQIITHLMSLC